MSGDDERDDPGTGARLGLRRGDGWALAMGALSGGFMTGVAAMCAVPRDGHPWVQLAVGLATVACALGAARAAGRVGAS